MFRIGIDPPRYMNTLHLVTLDYHVFHSYAIPIKLATIATRGSHSRASGMLLMHSPGQFRLTRDMRLRTLSSVCAQPIVPTEW